MIKSLKYHYRLYWKNRINTSRKLRTYTRFKSEFKREEYLDIRNYRHRQSITRIRTSSHFLAIERGRYTHPITPLDRRTCFYCPNTLEDKHHFMIDCPAYTLTRKKLYNSIINLTPCFEVLNDEEKFDFLMKSENGVSNHEGEYIFRILSGMKLSDQSEVYNY